MLTCALCGKLLPESYWTVKRGEKKDCFCSERCADFVIENKYRFCFFCGQIISGQPWFNPDGTLSCETCYRNGVKSQDELEENWDEVLDIFIDRFSYAPPCGVKPGFMYDDSEYEISVNYADCNGLHCFVKYDDRHSCFKVYIRRGLSSRQCQSTMAHEIAHDLMYHIWGDPGDNVVSEGFAVYMQSLYNIASNHQELNKNLALPRNTQGNSPDPYSEGYKKISRIAECEGYKGVMRFMREASAKNNFMRSN